MKHTKKFYYFLLLVLFIIFSKDIALANANSTNIFNSMYIKHDLEAWDNPPETYIPSKITYSSVTTESAHVVWRVEPSIVVEGSWDVNLNTRIVSNVVDPSPVDGAHTFVWIFTNISIDDQVIISRVADGDSTFNVTNKLIHNFPNYGLLGVIQLEDELGSRLWYSNSTGILLNGTFYWLFGTRWMKYNFKSTNVFSGPSQEAEIPGYNVYLLFSIGTIVIIILLTKQKIKYKN